jgi:hypothetical protein
MIEEIQIAPMKCLGCGRYSSGELNRPLHFIDMGFDVEFHGQAFICVEGCFREIMNQLGVLTRPQTLTLQARLENLEAENQRLHLQNRELTDAMGSLNRAGALSSAVFASLSTSATLAREENQPVVSRKSSSKSSRTEQRLVEQTDVGGSSDLPDSPGDELLDDI